MFKLKKMVPDVWNTKIKKSKPCSIRNKVRFFFLSFWLESVYFTGGWKASSKRCWTPLLPLQWPLLTTTKWGVRVTYFSARLLQNNCCHNLSEKPVQIKPSFLNRFPYNELLLTDPLFGHTVASLSDFVDCLQRLQGCSWKHRVFHGLDKELEESKSHSKHVIIRLGLLWVYCLWKQFWKFVTAMRRKKREGMKAF